MSLASVLAAVTYPTNVTGTGISAIPTGDPLRGTIEGWISSLYPSPRAAQTLEAAAAAGNLNFVQTTEGTGAGQTSSGAWVIAINLSQIQDIYYFNDKGQLVHEIPELSLIHEVFHAGPPSLNDPLPVGQVPTNAMMNAGFDFDGDVVRMQNEVARERSHLNNIQKNYYAAMLQGSSLYARFDRSVSYSEGRTIDVTIIPESLGAGNDTLTPIVHGAGGTVIANAVDVIFGLGGDDSLNGGAGSDYLYGGADKDTFIGSDGDDLFHGGGTRDSTGAAVALDDDGEDTADYSAAAATEFIKITTDVTVNSFHSGAIDGAHRLLIQQTGAGKGTATIVSVEKIKGTAGVDTFEVTQLVAAQLAGSDGKGGLAWVDLALQDKPSLEGDLIDATRMTEKLVIDLNPTAGFIQVEGDAEKKVTVLNAERAWGGDKDDKITGNDEANELKGGFGDDILVGGNGNDVFEGGPDDDQIWGGALNAAASASDGIDEVRYDQSIIVEFSATPASELIVKVAGTTDTLHSIERIVTTRGGHNTIWFNALSPTLLGTLERIDLGVNSGGSGDRVYLTRDVTEGVSINLATQRFDLISGAAGFDLIGVEEASGGSGDDILTGDEGANYLNGGDGVDEIRGGGGNDNMGSGNDDAVDQFWGGAGSDQFNVWASDVIRDIEADDILVRYRNIDLTGGIRWDTDDPTHYLGDGVAYYWAAGSTTLRVVDYVSGEPVTLTIENFQNGDAGIHLFAREGGDTTGTPGDDLLYGSIEEDGLSGAGGNDTINGGGGDDVLDGGDGNDTFLVGQGHGFDAIEGGAGIDTIRATANSVVIGILSAANVETITANGYANVSLRASELDDQYDFNGFTLIGITQIDAAGGNDTLIGNGLANVLLGGSGNDILAGAGGNDTLNGGDGDDTFLIGPDGGFHAIDGGAGADVIKASANNVAIGFSSVGNVETISADGFSNVSIRTTDADEWWDFYPNNVIGIDEINLGGGNDYLKAHSLTNLLHGGDGDDEIAAQEGDDALHGDAGNDILSGWHGDDNYYGGLGDDDLLDRSGDDSYHYGLGDGSDFLDDWEGFDVLVLGAGLTAANVVVSRDGDDIIFAFPDGGRIRVFDGADPQYAIDEVRFGNGTFWTFAETLYRADGAPVITGTAGADVLVGTGHPNAINGLAGNDTISGLGGDDTLTGGAGNDVLEGNDGGDTYVFARGDGNDTVTDYSMSAGTDAVSFAAGINQTQVTVGRTGDGASYILYLDGGAESLTLTGTVTWGDHYVIEEVRFADSTVWLASSLAGRFYGATNSADTIIATANVDIVHGLGGDDRIEGRASSDTLFGDDGNDVLLGEDGNDTLDGGGGNDTLDGGAGIDSMVGGAGNDTYFVDDAADAIVEGAGGGTDEVRTALAAYTLTAAEVENLTGTSTTGQTLTGSASANAITGGAGGDTLAGAGGNDSLSGGDGNDTLDGGVGIDSMVGGAGNDTYFVDDAADAIVEGAGGGTDEVRTALAAYTLTAAEVENLIGTSAAGQTLIGNASANLIRGAGGNDTLNGGEGVDSLVGGVGDDIYYIDVTGDSVTELAGEGDDTVWSKVTRTIGAEIENLSLWGGATINATGNALANILTGNGAINTLNGGAGADRMSGGAGHDIYVVDNLGDEVIEYGSSGNDKIESSVDYSLPTHVEKLTLTGTADIEGSGNTGDNILTGNGGDNYLSGGNGDDTITAGDGDDVIYGSAGDDALTGGAGADQFRFTVAPGTGNVDDIADFSVVDDRIFLARYAFTAFEGVSSFTSAHYRAGTAAGDATDRVIYDSATGNIYYDADGTGATAQILFATVTPGTALTYADFGIYA